MGEREIMRYGLLVVLICAFQLFAMSHYARPPVSVDLYPKIGIAGGDLRVRYSVLPHERNRLLRMSLDNGESFGRSSEEELNGADAPLTRTVWYHQIPSGHYLVEAIVGRSDGSTVRGAAHVCFAGSDVSC